MFRINHLLKLRHASLKFVQKSPIERATCFGAQRVEFHNWVRFYSKDKGDSSKKRIPHLNEDECPQKPTVEEECPQAKPEPPLVCARDKSNWWDAYKNAIFAGLLLAAATLGTLLFLGQTDETKEVKEEQKVKKKKPKRVPIKDPPSSTDIPAKVPYLLIGGGTASFAAFRAIKSADPKAKVLVITNESFHPYMRPPLSKEMWYNEDNESVKKLIFKQWNGSERNLFYEPEDFYIKCTQLNSNPNGGVAVARGYTVDRIDVFDRVAYLSDGYAIEYDKCLLATGANPKLLNVFEAACSSDPNVDERVKLFRNIYDFEDVYEAFEESKAVAIIGGGFLGSELACALARKGKKKRIDVYQIFREKGSMGKILPEYLSNWTTAKVRAEGVNILSNTEVIGVKFDDERLTLILTDGKMIAVDHAIVAVGIEPNTEMAEKSGLEVDPELGGFLVNTELMARSHLYIAGDCACFYDTKLGRRRVEHHDHAVVTGRLAGENMAGGRNPYLHQSMFWSDLGPDVGYEAIGVVDSSLPTVGVFAKGSDKDTPKAVVTETGEGIRSKTEAQQGIVQQKKEEKEEEEDGEKKVEKSQDYGKGVVFYLRDDVVVGIVLWNVFNRMATARQVLKDERKYDDLNEVAKLFNIHED